MSDRQRGRVRVHFGFDEVTSIDRGGLRRYRVGDLWGLCRANGHEVTEAIYTNISHYQVAKGCWLCNGETTEIHPGEIDVEIPIPENWAELTRR